MILPRSAEGLPPWRRHVATWIMGTLRLVMAWVLGRTAFLALIAPAGGFIGEVMPAPARWLVLAALVIGAVLFAWSRTVVVGFVLLAAGLGVFEFYFRKWGAQVSTTFWWSLAVLAVLAAGEWLVRRVQQRMYANAPRERRDPLG
jgi:hypothetical protein